MIEELAEHLLRPLARLVLWVVVEILWRFACHVIGWAFLRVVTLGRFPDHGLFDSRDSGAAEVVGLIVLVLLLAVALAGLWG